MSITIIKPIISIGTSRGITLPAKELKRQGIELGDEVMITVKPAPKESSRIDKEYAEFKRQYGETLKNLAKR